MQEDFNDMEKQQEIYKKYRPKNLRDVIGQDGAVKSIQKLLELGRIPHAILLTGPSGVGKTTIARILKTHLNCSDQDFIERNCADFKGVDDIREIRRHSGFAPLNGRSRIFLIDEAHKLTNDAQNALLKMLEDTPAHIYFMLCTTDPQKLIKTIHTRCSQIKLVGMDRPSLEKLLRSVIEKESLEVSKEVIYEIVDAAEGSARKALVILEQVGSLDSSEEQLAAVQATSMAKEKAIQLAQEMLKPGCSWKPVAAILRAIESEEPEGLRFMVLGYMRAVLLGGGHLAPRAYMIIDIFSSNFWDSKHAGLAAACWEVVNAH